MKNIKGILKNYIDIYFITKICLCERNNALLFPTQIIFEQFESLIFLL